MRATSDNAARVVIKIIRIGLNLLVLVVISYILPTFAARKNILFYFAAREFFYCPTVALAYILV
jgi:hypothetical protein